MLLSVSRRTDIPSYFSEWFVNRIKEGFLYVRNPMNPHQVSRIVLSPDVVDCIVFWTKNPVPMMERLEELKNYKYYFQFTLTGYGKDIEANLPDKKKVLIPTFQELARRIGNERVIWRYDPILLNARYTREYHLEAFEQIAMALKGCTKRCVISFVDYYAKNKKRMDEMAIHEVSEKELVELASRMQEIAAANGMEMVTCAEKIDLSACGIKHGSCIDKEVVEAVIGSSICVSKDKNQRSECGCVESIDVGYYNTCRNGCKYCYANYSEQSVMNNFQKYDVHAPLLCGKIEEDDVVKERLVTSIREEQLSIDIPSINN